MLLQMEDHKGKQLVNKTIIQDRTAVFTCIYENNVLLFLQPKNRSGDVPPYNHTQSYTQSVWVFS
jgi:hypothetical protein